MSVLISDTPVPASPGARWRLLLAAGGGVLLVIAILLALPGDIASRTHLALHGLCAQRPSHSLTLGGRVLPMDARMTGIYLGAATTIAVLTVTRRSRAARMLPVPVLAALALFVLAMAADGFNALLVDLHLPHPYEPHNLIRLVTGLLAGTSLGVGLVYLFAVSMWIDADPGRPAVSHARELVLPLLIAGSLGLLALTGWPILYAPYAIGLLGAALIVFWVLAMVLVALFTNRAWRFRTFGQMAGVAGVAWIAAIAMIGLLAGLRLVAEVQFGLPNLT